MFRQIGPWEIILILFVALLLFGAKRLPDIGRSMGRSMREFKSAVQGLDKDAEESPERERSSDPPRTGPE